MIINICRERKIFIDNFFLWNYRLQTVKSTNEFFCNRFYNFQNIIFLYKLSNCVIFEMFVTYFLFSGGQNPFFNPFGGSGTGSSDQRMVFNNVMNQNPSSPSTTVSSSGSVFASYGTVCSQHYIIFEFLLLNVLTSKWLQRVLQTTKGAYSPIHCL